jgi:hypothetical protein
MTYTEHITYLKLAFGCVGMGFTVEQIETILLTTEGVRKRKGNFNLMDAAKIKTAMYDKYEINNPFVKLEQIEDNRNESLK